MIPRQLTDRLKAMLSQEPAVGLLGPRQAGKTTLALEIADRVASVYLDLESPRDRAKLTDPFAFLDAHREELVVLDEIHRMPDLFGVLRGIIDEGRRRVKEHGRFLILGSGSLDMLRQSSESLAGRIGYLELGPLSAIEVASDQIQSRLWLRGGFPRSYLAPDDVTSLSWRQNFIRTYLERDIAQLGPRIPAETLRRFWTMLAHNQGQPFNAARIAGALGISGMTAGRYLDLMVDLLLVRRLSPWLSNTGKRLVRSPKVYVRDCGLTHALLNIDTLDTLLGHPVAGASWEGLVIENILMNLPPAAEAGFYRTSNGAEIDLVVSIPPHKLLAIEVKRSAAPSLERGFHIACDDLQPTAAFVVYPGVERFPLASDIIAISLPQLIDELLT
jgi:uncharacterized protein